MFFVSLGPLTLSFLVFLVSVLSGCWANPQPPLVWSQGPCMYEERSSCGGAETAMTGLLLSPWAVKSTLDLQGLSGPLYKCFNKVVFYLWSGLPFRVATPS